MGLSLLFAIGDKETIIDAAEKFDLDFFDKLETENKLADFSLHLIPDDLNFLVNSATELREITSFGLREYLDTETFYFDSEERGAFLVNPIIKILFADFNENEAGKITNQWFNKMRKEHNENLEVTDEAIVAVAKLISISKEAEASNMDLMHIWYL